MLQRKGVGNIAEGQARVRDTGLLPDPGLQHRTQVSWANHAARAVEKLQGKMCEGFVVFCLHQLIYVSCYYVKAKGKVESRCVVSM